MSITDELREYADKLEEAATRKSEHGFSPASLQLAAIADRIDERVKNIRFNEHHKGYQDGIMDGCSHYDPERTECMVSEEHAYIKLPVDADGEPWRLGDELMVEGEVCEVVGIGGHTIFYAFGDGVEWTIAHNNRHHHAPTVEDVLREFANEVYADADNEIRDRDFICAKYAKRLRLREDA